MRLSILVFAVLFTVGMSAPLNCIAYEPFSNPNYPKNVDLALNQDLKSLSSQGFTCIKSYYSQYYGLRVAEYAKKYNLKVILGVWMEDSSFLQAEIDAAIHSCLKFVNVVGLYAGNENLPDKTFDSILFIKNKLRNAGCNKPFGTVQTIGYLLTKPSRSFLDEMDWVGYNVYPFFTNLGGGSMIDSLRAQVAQLKAAYPDIFVRFRLAETGWPSDGGPSPQGNPSTVAKAKEFADQFAKYMCEGEIETDWVSYFTYFDPSYKSWAPAYERFFGISDNLGKVKWDVRNLNCGQTNSPQPPSGSGSSSSGSNTGAASGTGSNTGAASGTGSNTGAASGTGSNTGAAGGAASGAGSSTSNSGGAAANNGGSNAGASTSNPSNPKDRSFYFVDSDIKGADVGNRPAASADKCYDLCYDTNGCLAFTWTNHNGGTCWLKSSFAIRIRSAGAISGRLCELQDNKDVFGPVVASPAGIPRARGCCAACARNESCRAFAWNSFNGGTCWLKGKSDGLGDAPNVVGFGG